MCVFLNPMELKYPTLGALIFIIKYKGRGCALSKKELPKGLQANSDWLCG